MRICSSARGTQLKVKWPNEWIKWPWFGSILFDKCVSMLMYPHRSRSDSWNWKRRQTTGRTHTNLFYISQPSAATFDGEGKDAEIPIKSTSYTIFCGNRTDVWKQCTQFNFAQNQHFLSWSVMTDSSQMTAFAEETSTQFTVTFALYSSGCKLDY